MIPHAMLSVILDGVGLYGEVLHYAMIIAFFGTAFLALCYFWHKGRLDFDETPKTQMLLPEDNQHDRR